VGIYYSSQFAPLVVFFLLFLSVVKNTKLHHFVRFNAMQVCTSSKLVAVNVDLTSMQSSWGPVKHVGTVILFILAALLVTVQISASPESSTVAHVLSCHLSAINCYRSATVTDLSLHVVTKAG